MTQAISAVIKPPKRSRHKSARRFGAIAMTLLLTASVTTPAIAQTVTAQASKESDKQQVFLPTSARAANSPTESAQTAAEMQQMIEQTITVETQSWSPTQKSALQTLASMELTDSDLEALAALSASDLQTQLKSDKKLAKLSATGISSEEALKLAPMLLLSRYLLNIGRAAVWGGVVSAIRSANFDYIALSSALTTGNTNEFVSLLGEGLRGQDAFVNLVGSAATFACGSATLDFTPSLCNRFASGIQKVFTQVERSNARSRIRSDARSGARPGRVRELSSASASRPAIEIDKSH